MITLNCMWCGKAAEVESARSTDLDPRHPDNWYRVPATWLTTSWSDYESGGAEHACSVECIRARERASALTAEFKAAEKRAYGETKRNDERPDRTAFDAAEKHMAKVHGKAWRDLTVSPRERAEEERRKQR